MATEDQKDAVQRMERYMQSHLCQPITLKQLSDIAGYSPFHSARLFREITGKTPFDYLRALRLSQAAIRLRGSDARVLDVALDYVFDSHEGFTRAFAKTFGLSPRQYRQTKTPIPLFMPERMRLTPDRQRNEEDYNMAGMHQVLSPVFIQVMERPARKLLLKRGKKAEEYFSYCEETPCEVWDLLCGIKEALYEPIGLWLPDKLITPGTSKYVQGVELPFDYAGEVPDGFDLIDLAPCQIMVFQGAPYNDEDYSKEVGCVMRYIDQFDPTVYGYKWAAEDAPRFQFAPMGYRGYIEARPVKTAQ